MGIIDNQQAKEIAYQDAKKQVSCTHAFEVLHIEILNEDVELCSKCGLLKEHFLLSLSIPCFGQNCWYRKKCWVCQLCLLCKAQKAKVKQQERSKP